VLALHIVGNFQPAQTLNLPLRRTGPDRIGPPADAILAEALEHNAHNGRGQMGLRDQRFNMIDRL
jgi:hypothetical protein